jgi:hypothetical protein
MSIYHGNITVTMAADQQRILKLQHVIILLWIMQSLYCILLELMLIGHMVDKACLPLLIQADPCLFSVLAIALILFLAVTTNEGCLLLADSTFTLME